MSQDAITRAIVRRVYDARLRRGWSAAQLEDKLRRMGFDVSRSIIANLENHRCDHVTIEEVVGFCRGEER